ncbi:unnamed protein product [Parnassius mnemosyne]|uniref:CCHC-type domain-containing protein n=1 Tax=Parnassius mnemosyne TaxID=213953 RepID=A0AAV1LV51_9NEOP
MAYLGNLPIFDHKSSEWSIFKSRLTQFAKINRVEEVNKSGILLTHLTDETYRLVRNLAYPQDLESLSYSNLAKLLDGHFKPKKCSFVDKEKFFGATRNPGESLGDWAARLRGLASNCDFGTALETNLRDRFVLGLGPGPEQDKLFEHDPSTLTLSVAMELAEQAAYARQAKVMLCTSEHAPIKEEPVYRAKFQGQGDSGAVIRRPNAGRTSAGRDQPRDFSRCSVCGLKNHQSDKCRYKSYKCQKCGEKGHLKKVCDSVNRSRMYHIESVSEPEQVKDSSCEECHNFNLRYVTDKPISIDVIIGNQCMTMELDSGSSKSVISYNTYKEKFLKYSLPSSSVKMCLYNGHKIDPLGYITVETSYNNSTKLIKYFVVKNGGPPILGRDFMTAFNFVITTKLNYIRNDSELHELLYKYSALWRDELGAFNNFKVSLQLKANAVPKFFKPRTVPFALRESRTRAKPISALGYPCSY